MNKLTIKDIDLKQKRVLVRVDFNVPLSADGKITDDNRIRAAIPTIEYLLKQKCLVILMSHLGKPKGKVEAKYSLAVVAEHLKKLLNRDVVFVSDCIGQQVSDAINRAQAGDVILLENLRFHSEEEKNDPAFAQQLASSADLYVNDAFATAHRAHASTEGVTKYFPVALAGLLMEKEIKYLSYVIEAPKRPFVTIIGGAKITDKLGVIKNLLSKVDTLLIGGGLVFNFLKAQGFEIGKSICEPEMIDEARQLLNEHNLKIPVDILVADKIESNALTQNVKVNEIGENWLGVDIGQATIAEYQRQIKNAKTIVWAGPMGIFEIDKFANGSKMIGQAVSDATSQGAVSVVGGGDTTACLKKFGLQDKVSFVSTGGSASLEFLEGRTLPGIAALTDKKD